MRLLRSRLVDWIQAQSTEHICTTDIITIKHHPLHYFLSGL